MQAIDLHASPDHPLIGAMLTAPSHVAGACVTAVQEEFCPVHGHGVHLTLDQPHPRGDFVSMALEDVKLLGQPAGVQ